MRHSDRYQFEDEEARQVRALGILLRRKFKKADFGQIATLGTNVVLIVLGVVAAVIYGCQLSAFRDANDLTKQSIHTSGRAWIGMEDISPVSFEKGSDVDSNSRFLLTVVFKLRNYGHSAAQHVRIFPKLEPFSSVATTTGACDDSKAGLYVGDVIMPEQKREYPYGVRVTVADMESALKRQNPALGRNLALTLRGCIEYIDDPSEKVPHHTPFSYFVTRTSGDHFFTPDLQGVSGSDISLTSISVYPGPTD